jgi:hypothetical protein
MKMTRRASSSGISLTSRDAAVIKGMLVRGDRQHDIAAWFGVNSARIAEIAKGDRFCGVAVAAQEELPPSGPYYCGREIASALCAVTTAKEALDVAQRLFKTYGSGLVTH